MALNLEKPFVITSQGNKLELATMMINFPRKELMANLVLFDEKNIPIKQFPIRKVGEDFVKWYNEKYITHADAVDSLAKEIGFEGEVEDTIYN